jgi:hypothetical protein
MADKKKKAAKRHPPKPGYSPRLVGVDVLAALAGDAEHLDEGFDLLGGVLRLGVSFQGGETERQAVWRGSMRHWWGEGGAGTRGDGMEGSLAGKDGVRIGSCRRQERACHG